MEKKSKGIFVSYTPLILFYLVILGVIMAFLEVTGLEEPLSFKKLEVKLINGYSFITRRTLTWFNC